MACQHGVKVEVMSSGKGLWCYRDPDEDLNREHLVMQKYVEAVDDAKFSIDITFRSWFKLAGEGVHILYYLDGRPVLSDWIPRHDLANLGNGLVMKSAHHGFEFDSVTNGWVKAEWSFGKLDIREP